MTNKYNKNKEIRDKIFLEIKKDPLVVLRRSLYIITGDLSQAIILNQLIYWTTTMVENLDYIDNKEDEDQISILNASQINFDKDGWIYKSAKQLESELMLFRRSKLAKSLEILYNKGFLERRNNPYKDWDHTYQYKVDVDFYNKTVEIYSHLRNNKIFDPILVYHKKGKKRYKNLNHEDYKNLHDLYIKNYKSIIAIECQSITTTWQSLSTERQSNATDWQTIPEIINRDYNKDYSIDFFPAEKEKSNSKESLASLSEENKENNSIINNTSGDVYSNIESNVQNSYFNQFNGNGQKLEQFMQRVNVYGNKSKQDNEREKLLKIWINNYSLENVLKAIDAITFSTSIGQCTDTLASTYVFNAILKCIPDSNCLVYLENEKVVYKCKCGKVFDPDTDYDDNTKCSICATDIQTDIVADFISKNTVEKYNQL